MPCVSKERQLNIRADEGAGRVLRGSRRRRSKDVHLKLSGRNTVAGRISGEPFQNGTKGVTRFTSGESLR
jgi:hypothetical protein